MRVMDYQSGKALIADALERGAVRLSQATFAWDISGDCTDPPTVEITIRPPAPGYEKYVGIQSGTKHSMFMDMEVRCRKCENCLKARRKMWEARALNEWRRSHRTWLATLTLRPEEQLRCLYEARAVCRRKGYVDLEEMAPGAQFARLASASGQLVTNYLKRLRKDVGMRVFRYIAIAERHESGDPHWHLLIHEQRLDVPIRKRTLHKHWHHGFSSFKLTSGFSNATYPLKYIGKDLETRIRPSKAYGRLSQMVDPVDLAGQVRNVLEHSTQVRE